MSYRTLRLYYVEHYCTLNPIKTEYLKCQIHYSVHILSTILLKKTKMLVSGKLLFLSLFQECSVSQIKCVEIFSEELVNQSLFKTCCCAICTLLDTTTIFLKASTICMYCNLVPCCGKKTFIFKNMGLYSLFFLPIFCVIVKAF